MEGYKGIPGVAASIKGYFLIFTLQQFLGSVDAGHKSNGIMERSSENEFGKEPALWDSEYAKKGRGRTGKDKTDWPGINSYYKKYIVQYEGHVSGPDFVRLTAAPQGQNKYGFGYLGVCINNERLNDSDPESYFGSFTCPLDFEPQQHTFCCGNDYSEYCCEPAENKISEIVGPVLVVPLIIFIISIWIWSCFCKKKEAKEDEEAMNVKDQGEPPQEVKAASDTPPNDEDGYRTKSGRSNGASENHTSTTSINSDGDNGYGSGQLTDNKPPHDRPPTSGSNKGHQQARNHGYQDNEGSPDKVDKNRLHAGKNDEVATLSVSDGSIFEDQIL